MSKARRPKGEGSLYKFRDGRWAASVIIGYKTVEPTENGDGPWRRKRVPRRKRMFFVSKKAAALWLRRMLVKYDPKFALDMIVEEHLEQFIAEGRERWRVATYEMYSNLVRLHVLPTFGSRKVIEITTDEVRAWQRSMCERSVGMVTRKRAHQLMSSAMQPLVDEGRCGRNVFRAVKPPQPPKAEIYVPSPDELRRLIGACSDPQDRAIVLMAATSLMRIGELLALRYPDDVDFHKKRVTVLSSLSYDSDGRVTRGETKTKSSRRVVTLPDVAIDCLKKHLAHRAMLGVRTPWLFCLPCGSPIERHNFRSRVWLPLLKRAGLPSMHFHALRHAGNSLLLDAGVSVLVVASRMGHSDTRMTLDRYGHLVRAGADAEAAKITDKIFAEIVGKETATT